MIPIIGPIIGLISKFVPDSDKQAELAAQLEKEMTKQMELQASVIKQEAQLGGWAAKWRPMTMIAFVMMIIGHWVMYDVVPFIIVVFDIQFWTPQDPGFTTGLLDVVKLGLGGYIGGRSVEKVARIWKGK